MNLTASINKKQEKIRELKDLPCFKGKHRKIKILNKQLDNLIKKRKYKDVARIKGS